jgi:Secretion system C-terminal sorting domain
MFTPNTLALLITCFAVSANAQSLSPTVISPAGEVDQIDNISLEWTIGELAISTYQFDGQMLTEGFHQPLLSIERIAPPKDGADDNLEVIIAPNPVKHVLRVEVIDSQERILEFQLFDVRGALVERIKMDAYTQNFEIDMSGYTSGFYVLRVVGSESHTLLDAFKVAKID